MFEETNFMTQLLVFWGQFGCLQFDNAQHTLVFSQEYFNTKLITLQPLFTSLPTWHFPMLSINHLNPCKQKVPFPILKNSFMHGSVSRKPSCPQIMRMRNSKSTANIFNNEHHHLASSTQHNHESQQDQNINIKQLEGETHIGHKRSVQTILGCHDNFKIFEKAQHTESRECLLKEPASDAIDKVIIENNELSAELGRKQQQVKIIEEEYNELEQKYIRLLEVTNERSESHVKILLEEGQSRLNKSKLKNSSVSEQAQRLKSKLEGLDISSIKPNKDKDNSFKLSEVIN